MPYYVLRAAQFLLLMGAVVLSTTVLDKLKIVQKHKFIKFIPVVLTLILFFVPFEEMLTFSSKEAAFSGTVLGTPIAEAEQEESFGVFYKDKRDRYYVAFYTMENGRYRKCGDDDLEKPYSENADGISTEIFCLNETSERYLFVWTSGEVLSVSDESGNVFETQREKSATFILAPLSASCDTLTVNGVQWALS